MRHLLATLVAGAAISAVGCGGVGSADVDGEFGGYFFEFATVFGWIDAKQVEIDRGSVEFRNREAPILQVRFFGASFDPEQDVRFMSAEEQFALALDNEHNGVMRLSVTELDKVNDGDAIEIPPPDGADPSDPRLVITYELGLKKVRSDATYPGEVAAFGSDFSAKLTLESIGRAAGDTVKGSLVMTVKDDASDPPGARSGSMTVRFEAPLVNERIGECNTSADKTLCDTGRPPGR